MATINFQEVLVDASSTQCGEGLRFYLNKDPQAKLLLDQYQERSSTQFRSAAFGTLGTLFLVTGIYRISNSDRAGTDRFNQEKFWLIGSVALFGLNYLISAVLESMNEDLLLKSISTYNKRNSPKIFFRPHSKENDTGLEAGFTKEF